MGAVSAWVSIVQCLDNTKKEVCNVHLGVGVALLTGAGDPRAVDRKLGGEVEAGDAGSGDQTELLPRLGH